MLSVTRNALSGQSLQFAIGVGSKSTTASGPSVTTASTASTTHRSRRGKPAGGVRQDEQGERNEGERAQRVSEREEDGVVRCLEGAERPDEADGEHLRAGPVVRPVRRGDRAGDREHDARRGDEQDERLPLGQVVGQDEPEGDRVQDCCEPDRGGQPAARHGSSRRTAEPLSSAFEMKPRAPLVEISPL